MKKVIKHTRCRGGKLEHKFLQPYTIVEVKGSGGHIVKVKYSKVMKKSIPTDQIKLYFDQEIRQGNKSNKKGKVEDDDVHLHPANYSVCKYQRLKLCLTVMHIVTVKWRCSYR